MYSMSCHSGTVANAHEERLGVVGKLHVCQRNDGDPQDRSNRHATCFREECIVSSAAGR